VFTISGRGLRAAFIVITALAASVSAEAATIDFRAETWKLDGTNGPVHFDGVTATAGPYATLVHDGKEGLLVDYASLSTVAFDDETPAQLGPGLVEALTISFDDLRLVDGFTLNQKNHGSMGDAIGYFRINDVGDWQPFTVTNNGQGGFAVTLDQILVSKIAFAVNPIFGQDYWLRSIETAEVVKDVAEPTSMALVGAALFIGAARLRRRR